MSRPKSAASRGVVYIAYGEPARRECGASLDSLTKHNDPGVTIINEYPLLAYIDHKPLHMHSINIPDDRTDPGARRIKTRLDSLSPYDATLYLDADTRVHGSLTPLFDILDYWPLLLTYSTRQGDDVLGNCGAVDRAATFSEVGTPDLLGLQCGVIGFRRDDPRVRRLFAAWAEEWERYKDRDQAAFLRALHREPCPIWLVGRQFNGGSIVEHRHGAAARPRSAA